MVDSPGRGWYNQGKRGAAGASAAAQPRQVLSLEIWPLPMPGGGYFFFVTLITPKITTASRFSNARVSRTVTLSPPMYGGQAVPLPPDMDIAHFSGRVNGGDQWNPHFLQGFQHILRCSFAESAIIMKSRQGGRTHEILEDERGRKRLYHPQQPGRAPAPGGHSPNRPDAVPQAHVHRGRRADGGGGGGPGRRLQDAVLQLRRKRGGDVRQRGPVHLPLRL